jgi:hypothetical protein
VRPSLAIARRAGLEQQRHERMGLQPGDLAVANAARSGAHPRGALDPQQRPRAARRHAEPLST